MPSSYVVGYEQFAVDAFVLENQSCFIIHFLVGACVTPLCNANF